MDVARILERTSEPDTTARLQAWLAAARARMTPAQHEAMERWFNASPFDSGAQQAFRADRFDPPLLTQLAKRFAARRDAQPRLPDATAAIPEVMRIAHERPATASALVWHVLGATAPELASNLVQAIRERAMLPGLRRRIAAGEPPATPDSTWFADRQLEDAAAWAENVPAPVAPTLAEAIERTVAQRAAGGANVHELVPFVRQVASFLLALSRARRDPLGFALATDAQLVADPPLERRLEIAAWARTVQRAVCLRGQMLVLVIGVQAPWPLVLELIACEPGRGASGALGVLLRLRGAAPLPPGPEAPLLLCLPGEPVEQRGARFERWAQRAYPHAVDAWRGPA